eukprot:TRINITY_DN32280_c0_g1_i1.p1 TRINITY_DN32280_c0_g1~~TRINITY_DN32280_c0_g1_i1.p1  ORF type:complete len:1630 (+),score=254.37 TRINITY_DN32280_c0_g1_i1:68-4957(+)
MIRGTASSSQQYAVAPSSKHKAGPSNAYRPSTAGTRTTVTEAPQLAAVASARDQVAKPTRRPLAKPSVAPSVAPSAAPSVATARSFRGLEDEHAFIEEGGNTESGNTTALYSATGAYTQDAMLRGPSSAHALDSGSPRHMTHDQKVNDYDDQDEYFGEERDEIEHDNACETHDYDGSNSGRGVATGLAAVSGARRSLNQGNSSRDTMTAHADRLHGQRPQSSSTKAPPWQSALGKSAGNARSRSPALQSTASVYDPPAVSKRRLPQPPAEPPAPPQRKPQRPASPPLTRRQTARQSAEVPPQRRRMPEPESERPEAKRRRMQQQKAKLPIQEQKSRVLPLLCGDSPVCCLHGETGSGKSTQVPQMILEDAMRRGERVRIAVTQPRRVAALNLSKRVAEELGEQAAGNAVGFRIGGESRQGEKIDFCTVGYLLQLFTNVPDEFGKYTHIVLDEVHERTAESDMLCLVVRLLVSTRFPSTRVVVMSATLQGNLFADYFASVARSFGGPARVHVGARCFSVDNYFLEDISTTFRDKLKANKHVFSKLQNDLFPSGQDGKKKKIVPTHVDKFLHVVVDLVQCVAEEGTTILVFLPGIAEISTVWEEARGLEETGRFKVFPLHSMIPREEQELVFEDPEPSVTNVVLATDIAESSITLPHVVAVIDFGLHRRVDHDEKRGVSALVTKWISQAAATQRSGRAGRTRPGKCIRLYSRHWFDQVFEEFEPPESASMPLDKLYLSAKQLCEKLAVTIGDRAPRTAENVLQQLVQPPSMRAIAKARDYNAELGVLSSASETATITSLGRLSSQLPIDLPVARLVWLGCHWGVAADAIVLATVMSSLDTFAQPSPLFMRDESTFLDRHRSSSSCRMLFDGGQLSEPLMLRQLVLEWLLELHESEQIWGDKEYIFRARQRHTKNFAYRYSLSKGRMEHMVSQIQDLALRTLRLCEQGSRNETQLRRLISGLGYEVNEQGDLSEITRHSWKRFYIKGIFEDDPAYLKGLLAAAFSDNVLIGSYGSVPKELETVTNNLQNTQGVLKAMEDNKLQPQRTFVIPGDKKEPGSYVEFVCGIEPDKVVPATIGGVKWSLVQLPEFKVNRWPDLRSRSRANSDALNDSRRLSPEFNLVYAFDRHMRELSKANISGWTHGSIDMWHPSRVVWEWMQHVFGEPSGKQKNPKIVRCEATCDKKNPTGFVAHVQPLKDGKSIQNIAMFAVASQGHGGEISGRIFPSGVTVLAPGHVAFILATAMLKKTPLGLRTIALTTTGSLAILHRSITLPSGVINPKRWELICELRSALQSALAIRETSQNTWLHGRAGTLLRDSPVESIVRKLFDLLPCSHGSDEACPDEPHPSVPTLASTLVELAATDSNGGPLAFSPLASWSELKRRRQTISESAWTAAPAMPCAPDMAYIAELLQQQGKQGQQGQAAIGRKVMLLLQSQLGPPGTCAEIASVGPVQYFLSNGMFLPFFAEGYTWRFHGNSDPATFAPPAQAPQAQRTSAAPDSVREKIRKLCVGVVSTARSIKSESDRQLMVSTFEEVIRKGLMERGQLKGVKTTLKWAQAANFSDKAPQSQSCNSSTMIKLREVASLINTYLNGEIPGAAGAGAGAAGAGAAAALHKRWAELSGGGQCAKTEEK